VPHVHADGSLSGHDPELVNTQAEEPATSSEVGLGETAEADDTLAVSKTPAKKTTPAKKAAPKKAGSK